MSNRQEGFDYNDLCIISCMSIESGTEPVGSASPDLFDKIPIQQMLDNDDGSDEEDISHHSNPIPSLIAVGIPSFQAFPGLDDDDDEDFTSVPTSEDNDAIPIPVTPTNCCAASRAKNHESDVDYSGLLECLNGYVDDVEEDMVSDATDDEPIPWSQVFVETSTPKVLPIFVDTPPSKDGFIFVAPRPLRRNSAHGKELYPSQFAR